MRKMWMFVTLFMCVITISTYFVPTVDAASPKLISNSPTNGNTHICPPDPNAPCYGVIFKQTSQAMTSLSSQQLTCGINVYNGLNTLVAKIWTTVNVTWNYPDSYSFYVSNKSRGTWVVNGTYGWKNLSGPSGSTGDLGYHWAPYYYTSSGTATLLGIPFGSFTADLEIIGAYQWSCINY